MSVEGSGEGPREIPFLPDDVTHEIEQQLDILFESLPEKPCPRTRNGMSLTITERDEALFAREAALYRIVGFLSNPDTSQAAATYLTEQHEERGRPTFALYVYESIAEKLEPDTYDAATVSFLGFVDSLEAGKDDNEVHRVTDALRLRVVELAYQQEGIILDFELALTPEEEAELIAPLKEEYIGLLSVLESYRAKQLQAGARGLEAVMKAFDESPRSKIKRHEARLIRNDLDPELLKKHVLSGEFKTLPGNALACRKHDDILFQDLRRGGDIYMLRLAVVSGWFLVPSSTQRASVLFDYEHLFGSEKTLEEQRYALDNDEYLNDVTKDTAQAKHDLALYEACSDDSDALLKAFEDGLFYTQCGRDAARSRLHAYGIAVGATV